MIVNLHPYTEAIRATKSKDAAQVRAALRDLRDASDELAAMLALMVGRCRLTSG